MALYVRQLAWLNTAPDRPEGDKSKEPTLARREKMDRDGVPIELPPLDAPHLVEYLFEVGPTIPSGFGPAAISHTEIRNWQLNTGTLLTPWDCNILRSMSRAYVDQAHLSLRPECPAPMYTQDQQQAQRKAVDNKLRAFLGSSRVKRDDGTSR